MALFELAEEGGALDEVAGDLDGLAGLLDESSDLRRLIRSPVLGRDEQGRAIATIGERAGFQELTRNFLGFLANKRRLFALHDIIDAYRAMLAEHRGEVGAELISAVPLGDAQLERIRAQLGTSVGQTVNLTTAVDPELLGGLVIRVGSRMVDASLRSKLHQLELAMKGAA